MPLLMAAMAQAGGWGEPVHITHQDATVVTYRALAAGDMLLVEVALEPGWHTFAMDNKRRADEKLAGKMSLGLDQPTKFTLSGGLRAAGAWLQPEPRDFSKPDLRWYSWGYENKAVFAARVEKSGAGPGQVAVRAQACTETTCKNIDITLAAPFQKAGDSEAAVRSRYNLTHVQMGPDDRN
jgi:DsbC/DsbD-like thiol-disulfide interchange protein